MTVPSITDPRKEKIGSEDSLNIFKRNVTRLAHKTSPYVDMYLGTILTVFQIRSKQIKPHKLRGRGGIGTAEAALGHSTTLLRRHAGTETVTCSMKTASLLKPWQLKVHIHYLEKSPFCGTLRSW